MLYLHGLGFCSVEEKEEKEESYDPFESAAISEIPVKEYIPARIRRRMGRLAKLVYIAAIKALQDAGFFENFDGPMIFGTGYGELAIAVNLLKDLITRQGKDLSVIAIQNSVHNAPLSHLTIGLKAQAPALTISQGWLSAEAAFQTALTLLQVTGKKRVLVIQGDLYEPRWSEDLKAAGQPHLARKLVQSSLREGVAAFLLSLEAPKEEKNRRYGMLRDAGVWHGIDSTEQLRRFIERRAVSSQKIFLRSLVGGEDLAEELKAFVDIPVQLDERGRGTSLVGLAHQLHHFIMTESSFEDVLFLAKEHGDLAFLRWSR